MLERARPIGIVMLDALKRVPHEHWAKTLVREPMQPLTEALTTSPGDSVWAAFQKLV